MRMNKIPNALQNAFTEELGMRFQEVFGLALVTRINIVSMRLVSTRADGAPFTRKQHAWVAGFSAGYAGATDLVLAYTCR